MMLIKAREGSVLRLSPPSTLPKRRSLLLGAFFTFAFFSSVQAATWHVKLDGSDAANGSSWGTAFQTIQKAYESASAGDEIWVVAGTYYPSKDATGNASPSDARTKTFYFSKDVKIYGGFAGSEMELNERNWATNITILSGNIGAANDSTDNCYHVVHLYRRSAAMVLDGFTITRGTANGTSNATHGAGIYNDGTGSGFSSSPIISNCIFTLNAAVGNGGGIYNLGTTSGAAHPSISGCTFSLNSANNGGAIYNNANNGASSPSITGCTFSSNYSTNAGAAIYGNGGTSGTCSPAISKCVFSGNSSGNAGGAVYNNASSGTTSPTITNCVFSGNSAVSNSGVLYNNGGTGGTASPTLINCTIASNKAGGNGAVIHNNGSAGTANPTFTNCIIWGNSAVFHNNVGVPTVSYSIVQGGHTGDSNSSADPLFVDLEENTSAPTTSGDLHLQTCSPAIDAGTSTGAPATDLSGITRPQRSGYDIGAFEVSQPNTPPTIACPSDQTISTDGTCSGTVGAHNLVSKSDDCTASGSITESQSPASSTILTGYNSSQTVTLTATDAKGQTSSCAFTVTLKDDESPVALCRDRTVALDINGAASLAPADVNNGSSDNCTNGGTLSLALDDASYDCAEAGQRTLTLTVTDEAGNTAACNATLTVLDVINHAETGRRNASDGLANDKFGWGLALDGTTLAAGAPEDKVGTQNKQGSAYIFDGENDWSQAKHLKVASGASVDYFGNALALDGNTLLAGAHGDNIGANADQGSAYIFEKNLGGANNWGQRKQLFDPAGQPYDYFANAVSLKNGRALIGTAKAKIGATAARGCAYIFEKDLGGTDNWGLAKKIMADDGAANNFFGNSVAQAGSTAVVGANGNSNNRGAAYIFAQDFGGTGNWGQVKKLMAGDPAVGDGFGTSASLSGDFVLVGAPNKGTYMGAAYIFHRDAGGTDNWGQVKKLHATDCATNDRFGTSVVLDGDYAYVSAVRCGGSGAVYIFHRNAGGADNWGQLAKHTPSDGAANDQFGSALAVSGFNFAASSILDDVSGKTDQGSAYVFEGHDCGDDDRPEQTTTAAHSPVADAMPSVVCSPNPFRDALTVQIGAVGAVRLQITDATGRIVEQADLPASTARFDWQAIGQPTGLYFVQVAAEGGVQVVPVSLMR